MFVNGKVGDFSPFRGMGVCPALPGGDAAPTFLCLDKEKSPPQRWKRNRFVSKSCPCGQVWTNTGVVRDGASVIGQSPAGCAGVLGNREGASPHLGGLGGAFGVVIVWPLLLFPRSPLRLALPGGRGKDRFEGSRAAAAGRRKSNRFCTPTHGSSASRAACLQVSAKWGPHENPA